MSRNNLDPVKLTDLKDRFSGWHVPSDNDFAQLIAVANLPFSPGRGLSGGADIRPEDDAIINVTPLFVNVKDKGGIAIKDNVLVCLIADNGGGCIDAQNKVALSLASAGGISVDSTKIGITLPVKGPVVKKEAGIVSLVIDGTQGMQCVDKALCLNIDSQTLELAENGVGIKCQKNGYLIIDPDGCLAIDVDEILNSK